ncbi:hypothetical protein [Burkholderia stagnalis]|uniref:hypothetical protein n=1 Tax=Burkholderia stagnalis TaxID=1503054 RepID=UPI000A3FEC13|nr:hypothetical protein [Burkholderia stagnalis]
MLIEQALSDVTGALILMPGRSGDSMQALPQGFKDPAIAPDRKGKLECAEVQE